MPFDHSSRPARVVTRVARLVLGALALVWLSWTAAFVLVTAASGMYISPGELGSSYVASFRFLWQPGLELATAVQALALLIGVGLATGWALWRASRWYARRRAEARMRGTGGGASGSRPAA